MRQITLQLSTLHRNDNIIVKHLTEASVGQLSGTQTQFSCHHLGAGDCLRISRYGVGGAASLELYVDINQNQLSFDRQSVMFVNPIC